MSPNLLHRGYHKHSALRRARSIGLIRIRRTPPFSDEAFDWAHPTSDESSELIRPAHPKNSRMSSDQGVVKYGILQLLGSDELDTHVAHGRTRPLAQGVFVYINRKSKGFDDYLIRIPIEWSR